MYGDPDHLDLLADSLSEQASIVRDRMVARMMQSDMAQWHSTSADAWRARVHEETARAAHAADRLEQAAAALRVHAQECRETIALIARIENQTRGWLADQADALQSGGRHLLSGAAKAVHEVGHGFGEAVKLPPSGDVAWLDIGLSMSRQGLW